MTGASIALHYRPAAPEAVVLGAVSGIGGGMLRDLLVREVPHVLRSGLYAIPAIVGAAIVVAAASRAGQHGVLFSLLAASTCFAIRVVAIRCDVNLPVTASGLTDTDLDRAVAEIAIAGDAEACAGAIERLTQAGADSVVLRPRVHGGMAQVARFGAEVLAVLASRVP